MKFSELPYERVDIEKLTEQIRMKTEAFINADSASGQLKCIRDMDTVLQHAYTMLNLAYIRYTIDTTDAFYAEEQKYGGSIRPLIAEALQDYYKAFLTSPFRKELTEELGEVMFRKQEFALKGFSPKITKLAQEESELEARYQALMGSAQISYEGKTYTMAEMGQFTTSPNRRVRKLAYVAMGNFYDSVRGELDDIFDKMVKNRTSQAKKLGFDSYVDLAYIRRERFYGIEDVRSFRRQVVEELVPVICRLKKEQAIRIHTGHICLYDDGFLFNEGNAKPQGDAEQLLKAARRMYTQMSPETAEFIKALFDMEFYDVLAKPGKTSGAYCESLPDYGCPFIFSSFNQTAGDVETLTHEAGHAFADYVVSRQIPYMDLKLPTMEGAETHSMAMEFLTMPWHKLFFDDETEKYEYGHLTGALSLIAYGCMVDHFQEIVYLNPELTPEERNQEWLKLEKVYRPYLDMENVPCYSRGAGWQRQLHFYTVPYYYIDYCLAETVALQFWMQSEKDWKAAWENYLAFVKQGGTKGFVELVEGAGLVSPFKEGSLKPIMEYAGEWIEKHSDMK